MRRRIPPENTPRVLLVAAIFLGVLFAVLPRAQMALVGTFVAAIAVLAYLVDQQLRRWVEGRIAALARKASARFRSAPGASPDAKRDAA